MSHKAYKEGEIIDKTESMSESVAQQSTCGNDPAYHPPLLIESLLLLAKIAAIVIALFLLFTFIFGININNDSAMAPTVSDGDLVVYYRFDKDYLATETVALEFEGTVQVRRVVATAGDTVDITEEGLLVNGALQQEEAISAKTKRYHDGADFPLTLGEGQVFVLGDNRENATDSRVYGAVDVKNTLGKVVSIIKTRDI